MIVCICNNVNSATIKSVLDQGVNTIQGVREKTQATACCGKCQFKVNGLIQAHTAEKVIPQRELQKA